MMAGVVRIPEFYTRIQYAGESDEQFEVRCRAIEEHNSEAERIEQAWAPAPMKGLREGWDCGCPLYAEHHGCPHTNCPRWV